MTRDDLLFQLRSLEIQLLSPETVDFIKAQDEPTRKKFVALSFDLRVIIMKLTTAILSEIANRLEDLSKEIQDGIDNLEKEIKKTQKTVKIVNTLSTVVGFAARIVGLVI